VSEVVIEEGLSPLGAAWDTMTFSTYRHLLSLLGRGPVNAQDSRPIACRALVDGRPAGLVLAQIAAGHPSSAELLSMFVASDVRSQGIATRLLAGLEHAALVRHGVRQITGSYMTGKPTIPALERVFAKRGFSPPARRTVVLRFTPEEASHCEWYKKARLPPDSSIFPWTELSSDDRRQLRQSQAERGWIPPELEPWRCEEHFDEASSVGLRKAGEVVGWVINHQIAPHMVRFTTSFVRNDLARRGAIFPLYVAAFQHLGPEMICTFVTAAQFESMVRFVLRRCAPFAGFSGETRGVTKDLLGLPSADAPR
jgi:GNAT superfamily N-acetyltransferase